MQIMPIFKIEEEMVTIEEGVAIQMNSNKTKEGEEESSILEAVLSLQHLEIITLSKYLQAMISNKE